MFFISFCFVKAHDEKEYITQTMVLVCWTEMMQISLDTPYNNYCWITKQVIKHINIIHIDMQVRGFTAHLLYGLFQIPFSMNIF